MEQKKMNHIPYFGMKAMWPYIRPYKTRYLWMIILSATVSVIDAIYPLFNQYVINHFIALSTLDTLTAFVILYILILVVQAVMNYISTYLLSKSEMDLDRDLRNAAFNHVQTLSFSYFNQNSVGNIHSTVMSDTGKIGEFMAWSFMDLIWNGAYLLFMMVVMFSVNVRLAVLVLVIVPIATLLVSYFEKKLIELNRAIRKSNSKITGNFNEGITGIKTIKVLTIEALLKKEFEEETAHMKRESTRSAHESALFMSVVTLIGSIILSVMLSAGGAMSMEGILALGTLSVFMNYAMNLMEPIQIIVSSFAGLIAVQASVERFDTLMHTQSEVNDSSEVIERYGDTFHPKKENWEPIQGDIEFQDVTFRYPDGEENVLEHFNLQVRQGTSVALVGETGAGKSTLVNLVCRFYEPTDGTILLDGKDLKERSILWLHSSIGYVLQTPHLFSGTVRDNLRYANPKATDEEILEALRTVSAENLVKRLDRGLDSDVGEGGDRLSTGEKQLLCFARAILANPKILILDEATASVDTLTENRIQEAMQAVIRGRTSFVVAHRLSTIIHSDIILAIQDGKIVEQGTHEELMRKHGYYYALYNRQFEAESTDIVTSRGKIGS